LKGFTYYKKKWFTTSECNCSLPTFTWNERRLVLVGRTKSSRI